MFDELVAFYDEEVIPDTEIRKVRYDLKNGDAVASAKLILAAREARWDDVVALLEQGADPRICREIDAAGYTISALGYAVSLGEYDIAVKLYNAGDRLDDFLMDRVAYVTSAEGSKHPDKYDYNGVSFLATRMAAGYNYFVDDSKPLYECVRPCLYAQFLEKLDSASQEERNLAAVMTIVSSWHHDYQADIYIKMLEKLLEKGIDLSADGDKMLADIAKYRSQKIPTLLRLSDEKMERLEELIRKAM